MPRRYGRRRTQYGRSRRSTRRIGRRRYGRRRMRTPRAGRIGFRL